MDKISSVLKSFEVLEQFGNDLIKEINKYKDTMHPEAHECAIMVAEGMTTAIASHGALIEIAFSNKRLS